MKTTSRRVRWGLVAGIMIAATILRFSGIHAKSLWGDEVVCLTVSTGHSWYPWNDEETELFYDASHYRDLLSLAPTYFSQRLVSLLRVNDQIPPLYYLLLNLWLHAFGTSVVALRSLPLLANIASIPVAYALGRTIASHRAGVYAASIIAVAPFQVAFALYSRPYALLGFFALLSTLAAVHLSRGDGRRRWMFVYAAAAVLGVYTHYLFVWNLVCHAVLVTFYQRRNPRFLRRGALMALVVIGLCLLWAPTFLAQIRWSREVGPQSWFYWYSGSPSILNSIVSLGRDVLLLLTAGKIDGVCGGAGAGAECWAGRALARLAYLSPALILGLCATRMRRHFRQRTDPNGPAPDPWALCLLWGGCVLAGPVIGDVLLGSHMVYSHRYFICASGPVYLGAAMAVAAGKRDDLRRGLAAALLLFLLTGSVLYLRGSAATLMYEIAAREVAQWVDQSPGREPDLVVMLDPGLNPMDFAYYLRSNPDFARVDAPEARPSAPDVAVQLRAIAGARQRKRIWYLDGHGPEVRAHAEILDWLRAHYNQIEMKEYSNVSVFLFSPGL